MAIKEDDKKEDLETPAAEAEHGEEEGSESSEAIVRAAAEPPADPLAYESDADDASKDEGPVAAPTQLGFRRFVYAAYFAGAIAIAFMTSKVVDLAWGRLAQWKPTIGEPRDEIVMPAAAIFGAIAAFYYWRRTRARQLAEQVAEELSKVTWPDRKEVTNSTFVVIVTTLVSTIFFALMDRFWGFVTNLVYGT
jgi:preprotein translocase subunit SecE